MGTNEDRRSSLRQAFRQLENAELYVVAARELAGADTEAGRALERLRQQVVTVADDRRHELDGYPLVRGDARFVAPETIVVGFQNGVETVAALTRAVGAAHTAGGVSYVSAVIAEPGVIKHTAMDHLIFGMPDGSRSSPLEALLEACKPAGFQSTLSPDITVEIWTKFVRLSVFSGMTAVTRGPIGPIVNDPDLLEMLKAAVRETLAVAHAKGVAVTKTIDEDVAAAYKALPPQAKASMLEDLERGRRIELPWLSGAVVRIGREVGVPTPIHSFIATVLKPYINGRA